MTEQETKEHKLKRKSSYIVVILRSLMHKACICCNEPINTFEESAEHWDKELKKAQYNKEQYSFFEEAFDDGAGD